MIIDTLEDLYIDQLDDAYSANCQALAAFKELALTANDEDLSGALACGVEGIELGVNSLLRIARGHDEHLGKAHCTAMENLVKALDGHLVANRFGENETRDAMIIIQYQRLAYFVGAIYGCLAAFADRLELDHDVAILSKYIESNRERDQTMIFLAKGGPSEI